MASPSAVKNSATQEISGFVLAGGRGSRLGQDKVLLPWKGQTLLGHALRRLQQVCQSIRICADRTDLQPHLSGSDFQIAGPVIPDALPDAGPLGAIVAALEQSQTDWNLFLAVDLPFVPVELLRALVARTESSQAIRDGIVCVVPQVDDLPQPLCALYHRGLAPGLRRALMEGKYKIMLAVREAVRSLPDSRIPSSALMSGTPIPHVEFFCVRGFAAATNRPTSADEWLLNINTPQDWDRARKLSCT